MSARELAIWPAISACEPAVWKPPLLEPKRPTNDWNFRNSNFELVSKLRCHSLLIELETRRAASSKVCWIARTDRLPFGRLSNSAAFRFASKQWQRRRKMEKRTK